MKLELTLNVAFAVALGTGLCTATTTLGQALLRPGEPIYDRGRSQPPAPVPGRIAQRGHAALMSWDGIDVAHVRLITKDEIVAGLDRGKDLAWLLGTRNPRAIEALDRLLPTHLGKEAFEAERRIFAHTINSAASGIPTSWPFDVIRETQGLTSGGVNTGALQHLLIASCMAGMIDGEGVIARGDDGPVMIARFSSPMGNIRDMLTPMIVEDEKGGRAFMLSILGTTVPLAGVNSKGFAMARMAPPYLREAFKEAFGPDAAIQARIFLLHYQHAGFETTANLAGVGRFLLSLAEPNETEEIITRLATPGIVLAADGKEGYRFEWWSSTAREEPTPPEFAGLDNGVGAPPVTALSLFSAPELRGDIPEPSPRLLKEITALGPGAMTAGRIERVLTAQSKDELRVVFVPGKRAAYLLNSDGAVVEISLTRPVSPAWPTR
ncbi:MAG: hypothetical protein L6Q71_10840 [Planctomycetes bacterium]|nr:hypothetical protein [Planctomycetota bacterium]